MIIFFFEIIVKLLIAYEKWLSIKIHNGIVNQHLNLDDFKWIKFFKTTEPETFHALDSNRISYSQGTMIYENQYKGVYIKFLAIFQRSAHLYFCNYELNTKNTFTQTAKNWQRAWYLWKDLKTSRAVVALLTYIYLNSFFLLALLDNKLIFE